MENRESPESSRESEGTDPRVASGTPAARVSVVLMTAPTTADAMRIARNLVEERLAACVNVIDKIRSIYRWQGKIESEPECLLVAKTASSAVGRLATRVRELHPYTTPEIVGLPLESGSVAYLDWVLQNTDSE